jgi:CRP-like cAMP-binding protein
MSATAMNMDVIRRCPLFKLLDDEQFAHIEPRLQIIKLAAGEILYSEGAPADTVSIVTEGALEAIKMRLEKLHCYLIASAQPVSAHRHPPQ